MTGSITLDSEERIASVCHALNDSACRAIFEHLDEPASATELATICECSTSTIYRKLDRLRAAGLVERRYVILPDYSQSTRYVRAVEEITIGLEAVRTDSADDSSSGRPAKPSR